jgi:hypothetical protein
MYQPGTLLFREGQKKAKPYMNEDSGNSTGLEGDGDGMRVFGGGGGGERNGSGAGGAGRGECFLVGTWGGILSRWPERVEGAELLNALTAFLMRYVVVVKFAAETLALWVLHTYAFRLRDVTTYIGLESPQKRCGKTTFADGAKRWW